MSKEKSRPTIQLTKLTSVTLLICNAVAAVFYVVRAEPSWAVPEEHGIIPISGEPFVWFASVFSILVGAFFLNLIWGLIIFACRQWRSGRYGLSTIPIWLSAIVIDFAHH